MYVELSIAKIVANNQWVMVAICLLRVSNRSLFSFDMFSTC